MAVFLDDFDTVPLGLLHDDVVGGSRDFEHLEGDVLERHRTRFELAHVEHFVDELKKHLGRFFDFNAAIVALGDVVAAALGDVEHAHDAVQGRADVVAHAQEEVGFGAVGALGVLLGRDQLSLVGLFLFTLLALLLKVLFDDVVDDMEACNHRSLVVHLSHEELVVAHDAAVDAAVGAGVFILRGKNLTEVFCA